MIDTYRRRELMRIVVDNQITEEEADFLKDSAKLVATGEPPTCTVQYGETLAYAEKMLCALGKKIPAIKSVRERTNLGLKEAKDLVDDYCQTQDYHERCANNGGF